jgi:hypothetical protein
MLDGAALLAVQFLQMRRAHQCPAILQLFLEVRRRLCLSAIRSSVAFTIEGAAANRLTSTHRNI